MGAARLVCLNYWTCAVEPISQNYWSPHLEGLSWWWGEYAPQQEKALQWDARIPQLVSRPHWPQAEKVDAQQWRPRTDKNKQVNKIFKKKAFSLKKKKKKSTSPDGSRSNPQEIWLKIFSQVRIRFIRSMVLSWLYEVLRAVSTNTGEAKEGRAANVAPWRETAGWG